jgi:hypothetical protein
MLPANRRKSNRTQIFQKKETIMTYTKPEVAVLGEAVRVIESTHLKGNYTLSDGVNMHKVNPAYDLDE